MAWRVGWLLVGVWAWSVGGAPRPSPPRPGCDVEALRCDVICSFPDLGFHCSRCARRPMRFGKRGGGVDAALPPTFSTLMTSGTLGPAATVPPQADELDGLRFVGRPHLFLSKIFWRNTIGENFSFQERKLRLWKDRKKCYLSADDPTRCLQENVFTKWFRSAKDHRRHSRSGGESNENLCGINPEECPHGSDSSKKRLHGNVRPAEHPINGHSLSKRSHSNANLSNRTHSHGGRNTDSEKHKRHWNYTDKPPEPLRSHGDDNSITSRRHPSSPGRRRSRRSVVEDVVEGLMEMLHLEVLPVNPKHYGCHDLPFPGLE